MNMKNYTVKIIETVNDRKYYFREKLEGTVDLEGVCFRFSSLF